MKRTAQQVEEAKSVRTQTTRQMNPRSLANLRPWKPGQSANPGGRPKNDVSRKIAQAIFEGNESAVYAALGKELLKGSAYAFKELADRAYGKVSDKLEVSDADAVIARLTAARKRHGNSAG